MLGWGYAVGALLGGTASSQTGEGWPLVLAAAVLLGLVLFPSGARLAGAGLFAASLALGTAGAAAESRAFRSNRLHRWAAGDHPLPVWIRGTAAGDGVEIGRRLRVLLDVARVKEGGRERRLTGRLRVDVWGEAPHPEIRDGDRISVWARVHRLGGFADPGSVGAETRALREGLHAVGSCKTARLLHVEGRGAIGWHRRLASRLRRWARREIVARLPAGPEQSLVRAMVLGDRTGLSPETAETFRIAGTYHVLALSGAQVALVSALLIGGLRRLGLGPRGVAFAVSPLLAFYAEVVGAQTPVVRATVMAVILVSGGGLGLGAEMGNLLGLAALALLAPHPSAVGGVGFQLSFVATLGIIVLTAPLADWLPRLPLRLERGLAASIAAQAVLAPLLVLHFHRLAPAAVILNLLAVPLAGAVLLTGMALLATAATAPALAAQPAWLAAACARGLLLSGEVVRLVPGLDLRLPDPTYAALALSLAGAVGVMAVPRRRGAVLLLVAGHGALVVGGGPTSDGRMALTVLDVGQGDALVIRSPRGRVWLVDVGGAWPETGFDAGESVVAPFLWSQGIRRIQAIVLTHAHRDHVGGLASLLDDFPVGEVWEGPAPARDRVYRATDAVLARAEVIRRTVVRGVAAEWDGIAVRIRGPAAPGPRPATTRNDDSLVVELDYGHVRMLLAGDIEGTGESRLSVGPMTVLKVPHHGSVSSSSPGFVARIHPRVAIVSVGARNPFGHPGAPVLARYRSAGSRLLRTDRDGAVSVRTDGVRVWVEAYRGGG